MTMHFIKAPLVSCRLRRISPSGMVIRDVWLIKPLAIKGNTVTLKETNGDLEHDYVVEGIFPEEEAPGDVIIGYDMP